MPAPLDARGLPGGISAPATTQRVIELLHGLDWPNARVADVGAGRGHFSAVLGRQLENRRGLVPSEHVFPCDVIPETFEAAGLECARTRPDGTLPFDDDRFDAVVSIEVIEHVEDQFAFLRELARVARPGGLVVVTTPNVLNVSSRLRTLFTGFPTLFDPLPLAGQDIRLLDGHIHPVGPYYLAYGALRAGLVDLHLVGDRTRRSALLWTALLGPFLLAGQLGHRARFHFKRPRVAEENRRRLRDYGRLAMLTSRSAVLSARKPGATTDLR